MMGRRCGWGLKPWDRGETASHGRAKARSCLEAYPGSSAYRVPERMKNERGREGMGEGGNIHTLKAHCRASFALSKLLTGIYLSVDGGL